MTIDARIPLMGIQFNVADDMAKIEALKASRQAREYQRWQMDAAREDRTREGDRRQRLGDYMILSSQARHQDAPAMGDPNPSAGNTGTLRDIMRGGISGAMPETATTIGQLSQPGQPQGQFAQPGQSQADPRRAAYERAVRADPEAFLTFEGKRLDVGAKQLKGFRDLNDTAMQLLGGVNDQPSYEAAIRRAGALYASHGMDLSEMGLPAQYSPEIVESLRLQGMDTTKQLQSVARENKLNWDIEDDQLDNGRADQLATSTMAERTERQKITRQRVMDARARAKQESDDRRRGQDLSPRGGRKSVRVKSIEDARRLPPGTVFVTPDGRTKVR